MSITEQELVTVVLPHGQPILEWRPPSTPLEPVVRDRQLAIFQRSQQAPQDWLLELAAEEPSVVLSPSLSFWQGLVSRFIHQLCRIPEIEEWRGLAEVSLTDEEGEALLAEMPPMDGAEYLDVASLRHCWAGLLASFSRQIAIFPGTVAEFIHRLRPEIQLVGRIYFHLVENKGGEAPFAFLATYATRVNDSGQSQHLPLKFALQEYQDDQQKLLELLSTVQRAAAESALLTNLLESDELFHPLAWSAVEAFAFLQEIPLYEASGILCRIPNWWKGKAKGVRLTLRVGQDRPPVLGLSALLDFSPRLLLGDEEISIEEARRLLADAEGLAFIKNKWVEVDQVKLAELLAAYERAQAITDRQGVTLAEAMRLLLNPQGILGLGFAGQDEVVSISHGQWLEGVFATMRRPEASPELVPDARFAATLRPYQAAGLRWLAFLHSLGFGACLADDMGLGKTMQILAFFNLLTAAGGPKKPSLLVLPASLIANWEAEIERFFPSLSYAVAHPGRSQADHGLPPSLGTVASLDLVITTYAMVGRYDWLRETAWHLVILDEAQAIKNPATKQSRAVKALSADNRICMTGTPVENHLSDLWSLFDFINPGLLGNAKEFATYSKRLARAGEGAGYGALRRLISPFILRRMKSDKAIIQDLPAKVELKAWADLSRKQVALYQEMVERMMESVRDVEGIQRKGMVLAAITKFKQLCNHPDQYAGRDGYAEAESGKFSRLREICETIHDKREKVLIFTQFKEMAEPLARFLSTIFERPGLVLHGSVPVARRKEIVSQFQNEPYAPFLVLSLKAGGVGLNLTAANHVIHFDRWWNPAVENQATDRAFRIGQTRGVMVHKFLTRGTIEEKIDAMLEQKARLADEVIAGNGGEGWLTELDNQALREMVSLTPFPSDGA